MEKVNSLLTFVNSNLALVVIVLFGVVAFWLVVLSFKIGAASSKNTATKTILEDLSKDSYKAKKLFEQIKDLDSLDDRVKSIAKKKTEDIFFARITPLIDALDDIKERFKDVKDTQLAYMEERLNSIEEIVICLRAKINGEEVESEAFNPNLSEEEQVERLFNSGRSIEEISKTLGISISKVALILRSRNNI